MNQPQTNSSRMLVVDDEEKILTALCKYFRAKKYDVDPAHELEEAVALLSHIKYAVVIADIRLTGVGGIEGLDILSFVKQRHPNTKVLLLTAYGSPEIEMEAYKRGVDAFLHKPVSLADLSRTVEILLGNNL